MTDIEKLTELLRPWTAHLSLVAAKDLIANGVTFATDTNDGGKWIRVSGWNAPDKFKKVLCYFPQKDYGSKMEVSYNECEKGKRPYFAEEHIYGHTTHWMPLPEPPVGNPSVSLEADSSLCTREPLGADI